MSRADGNVDRFTGAHGDLTAIESYFRRARNDDPMLRTLRVFLVTQTFSGQHLDPFDLESRCFFEHGVRSPRPLIEFSHWSSLLRASFNHKKAVHEPERSVDGVCLSAFITELAGGFQGQIDHVVPTLDQHERRTAARLAQRAAKLSERSDRLPIHFLNQIALTDSRSSGATRGIDTCDQQSLIVSLESVTLRGFGSERL